MPSLAAKLGKCKLSRLLQLFKLLPKIFAVQPDRLLGALHGVVHEQSLKSAVGVQLISMKYFVGPRRSEI